MPFTAEELQYFDNVNLDFHLTGAAKSQVIQDRPLFNDLWAGKSNFPGGKEYIDGPVKGVYTSAMTGYEGDDEQVFDNPVNVKRWRVKWYEVAANVKMTYTELKKNGISVVEGPSMRTVQHSKSELIQLTNVLDDKNEDLIEGSRRSLANMFWQDGTQDTKAIPGLRALLLDANTTGSTENIDRAANSWWRNRVSLLLSVTTPADLAITNALQAEFRQLRRYAKNPKHKMYCGSTFLTAWEAELRSKGDFTLSGWAGKANMDASITDLAFKGVMAQYDPHLDDLSLDKYCFVVDLNAVKLKVMEGEEWKQFTPHRPPEVFVLYKQLTLTGAICASQLNSSGVYSIV